MQKLWIFFIIILFSVACNTVRAPRAIVSHGTHNPKLSPRLQTGLPRGEADYLLWTQHGSGLAACCSTAVAAGTGVWALRCTATDLYAVLACPHLQYVDLAHEKTRIETPVSGHDLGPNTLSLLHRTHPGLRGAGLRAGIKESAFNLTDPDLLNRTFTTPLTPPARTRHAAEIATLMVGAGNTGSKGMGAASAANITASNFESLMPDPLLYLDTNRISVQNHSYGTGVESYYGIEAALYDAQVSARPHLFHVFSAGNSGVGAADHGRYQNIAGFANLTGNFKSAKNVLCVAAVDTGLRRQFFSSKGPAHDGRIKPELCAYARQGTSEAAALTSGTALLLQDAYFKTQGQSLPPAALLRAVLFTGADDLDTPGPDFATGYGNLNASKSAEIILNTQFATGVLDVGGTFHLPLKIPKAAANLKITLAWIDPAAKPGADKALVHDLDLALLGPDNSRIWYPWVLSAAPHPDSLRRPAQPGTDTLNNQEQISLSVLPPGTYTIRVNARAWPDKRPQAFALAWHFDTIAHFRWTFPAKGDKLHTDRFDYNYLRWGTDLKDESARIEYARIGSANWKPIGKTVSLQRRRSLWTPPDTLAQYRLRMVAKQGVWYSDSFVGAPKLLLRTASACGDSILLSWNNIKGGTQYRLFELRGAYLTPLFDTPDTFALLHKNAVVRPYFAAVPLTKNQDTGINSLLSNYIEDNQTCYIQAFTANMLPTGSVQTALTISTSIGVAQFRIERTAPDNRILFQNATAPAKLFLNALDSMPQPGFNTYRASIFLKNGEVIHSPPVAVYNYYGGDNDVALLPNPVSAGQSLEIRSKVELNDAVFMLYDLMGREVLRSALQSKQTRIALPATLSGVYVYRIIRDKTALASGRIICIQQ